MPPDTTRLVDGLESRLRPLERAERVLQADSASAGSPGGDGCGAQPHREHG